jgi:hypothetical protein
VDVAGDLGAAEEASLLEATDHLLAAAEARCRAAKLQVTVTGPTMLLTTGPGVQLRAARAAAADIADLAASSQRSGLAVRVAISTRDILNPARWPAGSFLATVTSQ